MRNLNIDRDFVSRKDQSYKQEEVLLRIGERYQIHKLQVIDYFMNSKNIDLFLFVAVLIPRDSLIISEIKFKIIMVF